MIQLTNTPPIAQLMINFLTDNDKSKLFRTCKGWKKVQDYLRDQERINGHLKGEVWINHLTPPQRQKIYGIELPTLLKSTTIIWEINQNFLCGALYGAPQQKLERRAKEIAERLKNDDSVTAFHQNGRVLIAIATISLQFLKEYPTTAIPFAEAEVRSIVSITDNWENKTPAERVSDYKKSRKSSIHRLGIRNLKYIYFDHQTNEFIIHFMGSYVKSSDENGVPTSFHMESKAMKKQLFFSLAESAFARMRRS